MNPLCKDDCYFYYYSSCTKGNKCLYRHCEAALGTETVCALWREKRCYRENCKFRHMENRKKRDTLACYWEDQPSGCLKPHCVFMHSKPRMNISNNSGNEGLILPISTTPSEGNHTGQTSDAKDVSIVESFSNCISPRLSPTEHPVEPIVVSFDGEESDSESACSTPMKSTNDSKYSSSPVKKNLMDDLTDKKQNFGIKTLEQIRIEKVIKNETAMFFTDDDVDAITPDKSGLVRTATFLSDSFSLSDFHCLPKRDLAELLEAKAKEKVKANKFYKKGFPESDFTSESDQSAGQPVCSIDGVNHESHGKKVYNNRWTVKQKRTQPYSEQTMPPCKKKVSFKKNCNEDSLNFKIKTLEEIRRERGERLVNEEASAEQNSCRNASTNICSKSMPAVLSSTSQPSNFDGKSFRRLKIKRQTKEFLNSAVVPEANISNENKEKENRTQMILHEVQNISEEQNKSDAIIGKRKEIGDTSSGRSPKRLKTESSTDSSNNLPHTANAMSNISVKEKQVKKATRPVIKRNQLSSSISSVDSEKQPPATETGNIIQNSVKNSNNSEVDIKKQLISTPNEEQNSSVDALDNYLLNNGELPLDFEPEVAINGSQQYMKTVMDEAEDLLLEVEEILKN